MKLELLPPGITGFFDEPSDLPRVDPKLFKAACHVAARDMHVSVRMIDEEGRVTSYLSAVLDSGDASIAVLCNRVHPYLGFVQGEALPIVAHGPAFLSYNGSSDWIGFSLLDAAFLNADLTSEMLGALAPCELRQIRYWKPARVGDVIFNFWD